MINSSLKCGRGKFENKKEEPQELGVLGGDSPNVYWDCDFIPFQFRQITLRLIQN